MGWFSKHFGGIASDPALIDHVPVHIDEDAARAARHREKLELAAKRHGKPFKYAADGLPRIVTKDGIDVTVGVPLTLAPELPLPNVTTIKRKKS